MQTFQVPASIWLNLVLLAGAALFIWFKIAADASQREGRKGRGAAARLKLRR